MGLHGGLYNTCINNNIMTYIPNPTSTLSNSLSSNDGVLNVRSVLVSETDGGNFVNVPATPEGHLEVAIHSPQLPFGSIHVENLTPITQRDAVYGLLRSDMNYNSTGSGVVTASDSSFVVQTGTTIYSQAYIQSRKRLRYRPGQGVVCRFASGFSTPTLSSYQLAGIGPRFTLDNNVTPVNGTDVPILTLHNSYVYGGIVNQSIVNVTGITVGAKYGNPTIFKLVRNGNLTGNPNFQRFSTESCSLYDTAATGISYTTDQVIWSGSLGETGNIIQTFDNEIDELTLQPGEYLTLLIRGVGSAGASPVGLGSINIREDH